MNLKHVLGPPATVFFLIVSFIAGWNVTERIRDEPVITAFDQVKIGDEGWKTHNAIMALPEFNVGGGLPWGDTNYWFNGCKQRLVVHYEWEKVGIQWNWQKLVVVKKSLKPK